MQLMLQKIFKKFVAAFKSKHPNRKRSPDIKLDIEKHEEKSRYKELQTFK